MKEKGITLIALIVTIIVLIILAGITITTLTGEDGIINNANNAKEETEIANEKEIVDRATINAMGNNKRGNILKDELQNELDRITKVGDTEVEDTGKEFNVVFVNTQRYYTVNKDGDIIEEGKIIIDKSPGDITKDENGNDIEEGKPYEIWCIEDLVAFSNMVNGNGIIIENGKAIEIDTSTDFTNKIVELKTNLNFKSKYSYSNSERTDFGDINGNENDGNTLINEMTTGTGFKPIGTENSYFTGMFEGNNNKIDNIYINEKINNVGLFGCVYNSIIQNFVISGNIETTGDYVGGVIGRVRSTSNKQIINCANYCSIIGNKNVGGIVGSAGGEIRKCFNKGNILAKETHVGGIFGTSSGQSAELCYNNGKIEGKQYVGGIGGMQGGTAKIINCYSVNEIIYGSSKPGGIVATNNTSTSLAIQNCYFSNTSTNNVTGTGNTNNIINCKSMTEEEMKSDDFIDLLNENANEDIWKKDIENINDGYPTFK